VTRAKRLTLCRVRHLQWLLERLESDMTWVEQLLLICPGPEAREPFASLLVHALTLLAPAERIKYNEEEPVETTRMKVEEDSDDDGDDSNDDEERLRPTSIVVRFLQSYLYLVRPHRLHTNPRPSGVDSPHSHHHRTRTHVPPHRT